MAGGDSRGKLRNQVATLIVAGHETTAIALFWALHLLAREPDWQERSFPYAVYEAALAHAVGNGVERAYQRSDLLERRRALMHAWASYCACM
jgi:cytochrome P450